MIGHYHSSMESYRPAVVMQAVLKDHRTGLRWKVKNAESAKGHECRAVVFLIVEASDGGTRSGEASLTDASTSISIGYLRATRNLTTWFLAVLEMGED
jgi:hypothetical protein